MDLWCGDCHSDWLDPAVNAPAQSDTHINGRKKLPAVASETYRAKYKFKINSDSIYFPQ